MEIPIGSEFLLKEMDERKGWKSFPRENAIYVARHLLSNKFYSLEECKRQRALGLYLEKYVDILKCFAWSMHWLGWAAKKAGFSLKEVTRYSRDAK